MNYAEAKRAFRRGGVVKLIVGAVRSRQTPFQSFVELRKVGVTHSGTVRMLRLCVSQVPRKDKSQVEQ